MEDVIGTELWHGICDRLADTKEQEEAIQRHILAVSCLKSPPRTVASNVQDFQQMLAKDLDEVDKVVNSLDNSVICLEQSRAVYSSLRHPTSTASTWDQPQRELSLDLRAPILWWSAKNLVVRCPLCSATHAHTFSGAYKSVERIATCTTERLYHCEFPTKAFEIFKIKGESKECFVSRLTPWNEAECDLRKMPLPKHVEMSMRPLINEGHKESYSLIIEESELAYLCAVRHRNEEHCFTVLRTTCQLVSMYDWLPLPDDLRCSDPSSQCLKYDGKSRSSPYKSWTILIAMPPAGSPIWLVWPSDTSLASEAGRIPILRGKRRLDMTQPSTQQVLDGGEELSKDPDSELCHQMASLNIVSNTFGYKSLPKPVPQYRFQFSRTASPCKVIEQYEKGPSISAIERKTVAVLDRGFDFPKIYSKSGWIHLEVTDSNITSGKDYQKEALDIAKEIGHKFYNPDDSKHSEEYLACHAESQLIAYFIRHHCWLDDEIPFAGSSDSLLVREMICGDQGFRWIGGGKRRYNKKMLHLWARSPRERFRSARLYVSQEPCASCKNFRQACNRALDIDIAFTIME